MRMVQWPRPFRLLLCAFVVLTIALCLFFARTPGLAGSAELSPLETRLLGQDPGCGVGRPAVRLIATDHRSGRPIHAEVVLSLARLDHGKPVGMPSPCTAVKRMSLAPWMPISPPHAATPALIN